MASARKGSRPFLRCAPQWGITTIDNGARRPDVRYRAFVSFSHESASGSADGNIRLWDVPTHELIGTLGSEQQAIHSIALEPRTGILASVGADDSIVFWAVDFDEWTRRACRIVNRNLTPKEWNTYLGAGPYRKSCADLPGRQD